MNFEHRESSHPDRSRTHERQQHPARQRTIRGVIDLGWRLSSYEGVPIHDHGQSHDRADVLQNVTDHTRVHPEQVDRGAQHIDPARQPGARMGKAVPQDVRPGADEQRRNRQQPIQGTRRESVCLPLADPARTLRHERGQGTSQHQHEGEHYHPHRNIAHDAAEERVRIAYGQVESRGKIVGNVGSHAPDHERRRWQIFEAPQRHDSRGMRKCERHTGDSLAGLSCSCKRRLSTKLYGARAYSSRSAPTVARHR